MCCSVKFTHPYGWLDSADKYSGCPEDTVKITHAFRLGLIGTLGVGLGLMLLAIVGSLATVLTYIGVAFFIALGLDPAVRWLERRKFKKPLAITTVVLVFLAVVVGLVASVVPAFIDQSNHFITTLPQTVRDLETQAWFKWLENQLAAVDLRKVLQQAVAWVTNPANLSAIMGGLLKVGMTIAAAISGTIIVVILTLYFVASIETIKQSVYSFVPRTKRETFAEMTEQITGSIGKYIVGQVSLAALNGILCFFMLLFIGGKGAALWGFVAFVLALIPLIGTVLSTIVVSFSQLITASPMTALVILIYFLVYMQIEAYVISPRVMNKAVSVPGSIVVIAALAGGELMGVLGALIAIPVAASILLIIKQIVIPHIDKQ